MARRKKEVDPKIPMVELLFGKGVSVDFAEKLLLPDWFENLEKHFKVEETPVVLPVPKNVKYKQAYHKLVNHVEKMNDLIIKIKEETNE